MENHDSTNRDGVRSLVKTAVNVQYVGKLAAVALLAVLLLIPLNMIREQITQRSHYQRQVTAEVANSAAGAQTLTGPVLAIRYRTKTTADIYRDMNTGTVVARPAPPVERLAVVPAETLTIGGRADVEQRYRGIYKARLFHLDLQAEGVFNLPADLIPSGRKNEIVEAHAVMLLGISDLRGMDAAPEVLIDQRPMRFTAPKDKYFDSVLPGSRLELDLGALTLGKARTITFSLPLKLTGTEAFSIAPTAESNSVRLQSDWKHPSFQGRFLPRTRQIAHDGFSAQWEISGLARNLDGTLEEHDQEVLSIAFMEPVNIYLQSERAVKYGSLFIVLTFAAFFLGEILRRRPMHILQYLLVGLALAIFFLLLIALSEHLPFLNSYLAAAAACIGLISFYLAGVFGAWRPAFTFGGGLAGLYAMIYVILQLEDQALLMGSLLLFAVLAAVMLGTRRFDWYGLGQPGKNAPCARETQRYRERQAWESAELPADAPVVPDKEEE
ncbi:MAG: cell envelope integrity protein CreD [Azoarcus sp.]|jgi:inner membrane protein|nr:cell envelope integrity protein CreD [Azoarcus sp.]